MTPNLVTESIAAANSLNRFQLVKCIANEESGSNIYKTAAFAVKTALQTTSEEIKQSQDEFYRNMFAGPIIHALGDLLGKSPTELLGDKLPSIVTGYKPLIAALRIQPGAFQIHNVSLIIILCK